MNNISSIVVSIGLIFSNANIFGHRVGNGGDYVRSQFLKMGSAVVSFLRETEQGQKLLKDKNLDIASLEKILNIELISVSTVPLIDNSGSLVEAIGVPGSITLNSESWFDHFEKERDVYHLVFHEMLRAVGVDDDNYVISKALNPFPLSRRVDTRLFPAKPLPPEESLESIFNISNMALGGTGCPKNSIPTRVEFNGEKNILEILPGQMATVLKANTMDSKSCMLALPVSLPKNKKLKIALIDLSGSLTVDANLSTTLSFEAFLAGSTSPLQSKTWISSAPNQFSMLMRRTEVLESNCGGKDTLRLNTRLRAQILNAKSNKSIEPRVSTVKSLQLFLQLEDCQN